MKEITYAQAINEAISEEMRRDENVFMMGEDIGLYCGAFGVSRGMIQEFGGDRIMDTPIAEQAYVGAGVGAAMCGMRPIVELMFSDFMCVCFDELVNEAAKLRFMFGGKVKVPMVMRTASGAGTGAAAQHSQSLEACLAHFPGLKVVCASTATDAKGLLKSAIRDNDPVLFLEETAAYRMKEEVPIDPDFLVPIGKSKVVCEGNDLTVVSFGTAALKATKAIPLLEENGIHIQLIDLRSLRPLDLDPVIESVKRTGKLLVVDEYTETYGISGEIAFQVTEKCFSELKMPVQRCTLPETIIPAGPVMEDWVMLSPQKIADRVKEIVGG